MELLKATGKKWDSKCGGMCIDVYCPVCNKLTVHDDGSSGYTNKGPHYGFCDGGTVEQAGVYQFSCGCGHTWSEHVNMPDPPPEHAAANEESKNES